MVLIAGLSLLLYPSVANYVNDRNSTRLIGNYATAVSGLSEAEYDRLYQQAVDYNASLLERRNSFTLTDQQKVNYDELLNVSDDGIMGYVSIPSIDVTLPIYHGTDDVSLQVAVGHIDWSSLPVGGESSHCLISGHRGLPSAKLFTDLDRLSEGDIFMLRVLNEVLTYEVDQILIVVPSDTTALQIEKGKDYCTLITCTPYGINSHRLLVRGHRIKNLDYAANIRITAEAIQVEPLIVAPIIAMPFLITLLILVFVGNTSSNKKKNGGIKNA